MLPNIQSPLYISLEITYNCNNYCTGCINELSSSRLKKTSYSNWQKIIDSIHHCAALVRLTGGEPTLHPDIEDIISYLDYQKLPFVIFSHGRIRTIERILETLTKASNFLGFLISMHGGDARTHEKFTNIKYSYVEMIKGIEILSEKGLCFSTTTVIRDEIIDEIEAIADLAYRLGAESIYFNRYLGLIDEKVIVTDEKLRLAIRRVEYLRKERGYPTYIGNCIPQCFEEYEYPEFQINGFTSCTIDPEGNVRAGHHPETLGNVLNQSIEEIWRGKSLQIYMNQTPQLCRKCIYAFTCPGGSRALANKLGLSQDPHIIKTMVESRGKRIVISPKSIPVLTKFTKLRNEDFGCIIYNLNTMYPLSVSKEWIEELFNRKWSIEILEKEYGSEVIHFLGELNEAGLITLN